MREERGGSRRRFLSVWVALSRVEGPGAPPPLSVYRSVLLSPRAACPGGLLHLIWINEEVDLLFLSLSLSALLSREDYIVFTQAPHLLLSPHIFISDEISVSLLFCLFHFFLLGLFFPPPLPYLKSWQCVCVCVQLHISFCVD